MLNKTIFKSICRCKFTFIGFLFFMAFASSCNKEDDIPAQCLTDISTVRKINNKPAKVMAVGSQFYIIEENTIDTMLNPCNLKKEFQVHDLSVTISGDVKETPREGVCCIDDFVITKISRR